MVVALIFSGGAQAQDRPNIVLVLMDNLSWGEIGAYGGGILRGAPTPNIDNPAKRLCVHQEQSLFRGAVPLRRK